MWRSYINHILSEAFFGPSILVGVAAEIRQKIGFSFLRGGTRNLGPAKRSFLDGGAWKIIGICLRARMQFRRLFIYCAAASPGNETSRWAASRVRERSRAKRSLRCALGGPIPHYAYNSSSSARHTSRTLGSRQRHAHVEVSV